MLICIWNIVRQYFRIIYHVGLYPGVLHKSFETTLDQLSNSEPPIIAVTLADFMIVSGFQNGRSAQF